MKAAFRGFMEEGLFRGGFVSGGVVIAQWAGSVDPFVGMVLCGLLGAIVFSAIHWRKVRFLQNGQIVERDATPMDRLTHLALNVGLTALFAVVFLWISPLMLGATGGAMEKALLATVSAGIGHGLLYNAWLAPSLGLALGMAGPRGKKDKHPLGFLFGEASEDFIKSILNVDELEKLNAQFKTDFFAGKDTQKLERRMHRLGQTESALDDLLEEMFVEETRHFLFQEQSQSEQSLERMKRLISRLSENLDVSNLDRRGIGGKGSWSRDPYGQIRFVVNEEAFQFSFFSLLEKANEAGELNHIIAGQVVRLVIGCWPLLDEKEKSTLDDFPLFKNYLYETNGKLSDLRTKNLGEITWKHSESGRMTAQVFGGEFKVGLSWLQQKVSVVATNDKDAQAIVLALLPPLLLAVSEKERSALEKDIIQKFPDQGNPLLALAYGIALQTVLKRQLRSYDGSIPADRLRAQTMSQKAKQYANEREWDELSNEMKDLFLDFFEPDTIMMWWSSDIRHFPTTEDDLESALEVETFLFDLLGPKIKEAFLSRYINIYRSLLWIPSKHEWLSFFEKAISRLDPEGGEEFLKHEARSALSKICTARNITLDKKIGLLNGFLSTLDLAELVFIFVRGVLSEKTPASDIETMEKATRLFVQSFRLIIPGLLEAGPYRLFSFTLYKNQILDLGNRQPDMRLIVIQEFSRLYSQWPTFVSSPDIFRQMARWTGSEQAETREAAMSVLVSFCAGDQNSPDALARLWERVFVEHPNDFRVMAKALKDIRRIPGLATLSNRRPTYSNIPPWFIAAVESREKELAPASQHTPTSWDFLRNGAFPPSDIPPDRGSFVDPYEVKSLMTRGDRFEKGIEGSIARTRGKIKSPQYPRFLPANTMSEQLRQLLTIRSVVDGKKVIESIAEVFSLKPDFRSSIRSHLGLEDRNLIAPFFDATISIWSRANCSPKEAIELARTMLDLMNLFVSLTKETQHRLRSEGGLYTEDEIRRVTESPHEFISLIDLYVTSRGTGALSLESGYALFGMAFIRRRIARAVKSSRTSAGRDALTRFHEMTFDLFSNSSISVQGLQKTTGVLEYIYQNVALENFLLLYDRVGFEIAVGNLPMESVPLLTSLIARGKRNAPHLARELPHLLAEGLVLDEDTAPFLENRESTKDIIFLAKEHLVSNKNLVMQYMNADPAQRETLLSRWHEAINPMAGTKTFNLRPTSIEEKASKNKKERASALDVLVNPELIEKFNDEDEAQLIQLVRENLEKEPGQTAELISTALTVAWGLQRRSASRALLDLIFGLDPIQQKDAYERSREILVHSFGVFEAEELLARLRSVGGTGRASLANLRHAHEMACLYGELGIPEVGGKLQIYTSPTRTHSMIEDAKSLGVSVVKHTYEDLDVVTILLPPAVTADQAGEIVERILECLFPFLEGLTIEHQITFGGNLGDRAKSAALSRYIAVPPGSRILPPARTPFIYPGDRMGLLIPGGGVVKPAHPAFEERNGTRTDFRGRTIDAATIPRLLANRAVSADIQNIQMLMAGLNASGKGKDVWRQKAAKAYERFEKEMEFILFEMSDGHVNDPALGLLSLPWYSETTPEKSPWYSEWFALFPSLHALYEHLAGASEQRAGSPTWRRVSEARNHAVTEIQEALTEPLHRRISSDLLAQILGQRGVQEEIQRWDSEHEIIQATLAQTVLISCLGARPSDQDDFPELTLTELQRQTSLPPKAIRKALDSLLVGHGSLPPQVVMVRGGRDVLYRIHSSEPGRVATGETPIAQPQMNGNGDLGNAVVVQLPNGTPLRWVARKEGQLRDVLSASKSFAILHWVLANHFDFTKAAIARAIPGALFESKNIVAIDFIYNTSGSHKDVFEVVITLKGGKQIDSKFTVAYKQAIAGQDFEPGELEMLQSLESSGLVPRFGGQFKAYYLNATAEARTSIISEHDYLDRVSKGRSPPSADEFSIYIEEFIHGPTAQQLHEKGMLTSAHRAAVAGAYLQIWKQNNGRTPKDIHRGNWMFKNANDPTTVVMVDLGQVVPMTPQRVLEQLLIYFGYINDSFSPQANWGIYQAILGTLGEKEGAAFLEEAGRDMGTHRIKKRIENVALTRRAIEKRSTFYSRLQSLVKQVDPEKRTKIVSQINRNFKIRRQLAEKERKLLSSLPARIDQLNDMWDFLRSRGIQTPPPLSMELEKGTNFPLLLVENILIPFVVGLTSFIVTGMALGFDLGLFDLVIGGAVGLAAGITTHEAGHLLTARMGTGQWTPFHLTSKWIGIRMNENDLPRWHRAIALAGPVGGLMLIPFLLFSPIGLSLAPTALLAATVVVASMNIASLLRGDGEVVFAKKSMTLRALLAASPSAAPLLNDLHAPFRQILDMPVGRAREEFPNAVGSTLVGLQRSRSVFTGQILAVATALFVSATDPSLATLREKVERATQTEYEDIPAVLHDHSLVYLPGQIPLYKMIVNQENLESVNVLLNILAQQRKSDSENPVQALLVPADKKVAMALSRWNESADFVTIVPPPIGIVNGEIIDVQLCDQMIRAWAVSRGVTDMKAISLRWVLPKGYYWNFNDMESLGDSPLRQAALIILNQAFPLLGRVVDIQNAFRQAERMAQQA